jgi:hypothetical protein
LSLKLDKTGKIAPIEVGKERSPPREMENPFVKPADPFTSVRFSRSAWLTLVPALLQVVKDSLQPEQAWLWLKKE